MSAATKVFRILGDKHTKPEPAEHRMEFPGGSISVCRTTDGEYWAHIEVNHPERCGGYEPRGLDTHRGSADGAVTDARVDYVNRHASESPAVIPELKNVYHVAVRIGAQS